VPNRDRDQSVEHVLRRVLSDNGPALPQSSCVNGETIAAWTAGALRTDEAADVERHLVECARCQAMMAAFVRTTPPAPVRESIWHRWRLGLVVPLATAATAAAVWIALPDSAAVPSSRDRAASSVALEQQAPAAPARSAAPAAAEPSAPPVSLRDRRDTRASNNEVRKQSDETTLMRSAEERFAAAPVAPPAEGAAAGRRESDITMPVRTLAQAVAPVEIVAPGGTVRWRILSGRQVERSTTAGREWTPADIASPELLTSGAAPSSSVCWMVGRGGAIYMTTDGVRFERLPFPETADLILVTAVDDRTANVAAADGRSWRTVDQGRTWSAVK
jgi:hypothetical protein